MTNKKLYILVAIIGFVTVGDHFYFHDHAFGRQRALKILSQRQVGSEVDPAGKGYREIVVKNTGKTAWVFFECQNSVSVHPVLVPKGVHTIQLVTDTDYTVVSPPPCVIHEISTKDNSP